MSTVEIGSEQAPCVDDSAGQRVIQEKTRDWQQEAAVNPFNVPGTRPRGFHVPIFERLVSLLPAGSRVLDVGCGHGRLAIPLGEAGYRVVASDVSQQRLDLLEQHKRSSSVETRRGDAHQLPARDGEFDAVISSDFITHFPDWPVLLKEKARACRIGGRVIFNFNFQEHRDFARSFGDAAYEHPYSSDPASDKPFCAAASIAEMRSAGSAAGLRLLQAIPIKFFHDNFALGGAMGADEYHSLRQELTRRLEANSAAAEFYSWLEMNFLQRLPHFAAYCSLVVFERTDDAAESKSGAIEETGRVPAGGRVRPVEGRSYIDADTFLGEIPTETTRGERLLLLDYFQNRWDGAGKVVEIGPFLGGTTRAIAWGMSRNPRLAPGAELHTFDRFDHYYSPSKLRETIAPMVASGVLSASEADDLCRGADFERLFRAIHSRHSYARLVQLHNSALPDMPLEIETSTSMACLADESDLGAIFVDGCKSWASTHYAMKFLLPRTRVGAPVIFQDFGWYTCFWISSAAYALRDVLELEASVDATYVFRLKRAISADEVARRFARAPEQMGERFFTEAAEWLLHLSLQRQDVRGELIAQLHLVAAFATIDRKPQAAKLLGKLDVRRYAAFVAMIKGCIESPTYLPGGKQILWK